MDLIYLQSPLNEKICLELRAGDEILLSGTMYTARDAAHLRINQYIKEKGHPPFKVDGQIIYYSGPSPSSPQRKVGSIGPTTSMRMDDLSEPLLMNGLRGMVGKGERTEKLINLLNRYRSIYFVTIGGAGSLLSQRVKDMEPILYNDLGPEAIYRIQVQDFPLFVAYDFFGGSIFK